MAGGRDCGAGEAASALILAGGQGERLGRDKATLELGGQTLVQRLVKSLADLSDDVIVVARTGQQVEAKGARLVRDAPQFEGVLAGLAAGLTVATHEWVFVAACDMPFVNPGLVRYMLSLRCGYDIVVPALDVGLEPLHALYHQRCLPSLLQAATEGRRRVVSFFGSLRVRYVGPAEVALWDSDTRSFFNINTPEDLAQARQWLEASAGHPSRPRPPL